MPESGCQKQEIIPNSWSSSLQSPGHTAGGGGSKREAACNSWLGFFSSFMEKGGKVTFQPQKLPWEPFRAGINSSVCQGLRGASALLGSSSSSMLLSWGLWFAWSKEPTTAKGQKQSGVGPEGKIPLILGRWNSCDSRKRQNLFVTCCLCQPFKFKNPKSFSCVLEISAR